MRQGGQHSFACHRINRRQEDAVTTEGYLSTRVAVANSERKGIAAALERDKDILPILTDSMPAKHTALNLAAGDPTQSQIKKDIKSALWRRQAMGLDTAISWVRGHMGISGTELADPHAMFHAYFEHIAGTGRRATEGGIRQLTNAARAECRSVPTYGKGRGVGWKRRALAAYTWFRTGKGPQLEWLYRIGKAADPTCHCGAAIRTGKHIAWVCRLHTNERRRNPISSTTKGDWGAPDDPSWVPNEDMEGREETDDEQVYEVERFFDYLAAHF